MAGSYADAIRAGTMAATRLHVELGTKADVERHGGGIDVFGAAFTLGLPVLFRPLKSLLGAYLPFPSPGALVTTARPLNIQRFTGAHELGHHRLGHEPSLDSEGILRRMPLGGSRAVGSGYQEAEANAFAAAFMMPKWLLLWHCARQGWTVNYLYNPLIVYQLALRLGQSYEALTWTMERYNLISDSIGRQLRETQPRTIKVGLLADYRPVDYRGDVWLLTERDRDTVIEGSRNDHFVLRLREHGGAGYLWNAEELVASGFALIRDLTASDDLEGVGGEVTRELTVTPEIPARGKVLLEESRPWEPDAPLTQLALEYDLTGPEEEGYSRAERRKLLEVA
jgi:hypothetical protein